MGRVRRGAIFTSLHIAPPSTMRRTQRTVNSTNRNRMAQATNQAPGRNDAHPGRWARPDWQNHPGPRTHHRPHRAGHPHAIAHMDARPPPPIRGGAAPPAPGSSARLRAHHGGSAWPGFVLDGLLVRWAPPDRPGEVIIQDGYADRCAAFGMAGGPHLAACLALRWRRLFAPFDIAIYLHEESELRALSGREGRQLGRCHAGAYLGLLRRRQPEVGTSMTGGRARLRRGVPRRRAGQGRRR